MIKQLAAALACIIFTSSVSYAQTPLLQKGKRNIYERVLTTPTCELTKKYEDNKGTKVPAFTRFYVYEDKDKFIQVGPDTTGKNLGWLQRDCTVEWKTQTALMFTNPANRNRSLVFKDKPSLMNIVELDNPEQKDKVESMLNKVEKSQAVPDVISVEPKLYVDYQKQFYLLPILNFDEQMFSEGNYVRLLEIASITEKNSKASTNKAQESNALKSFNAAIVFVIDSSISMQPYIDRTKQSINTIIQDFQKNNLADRVHFGVVSFRSNTEKTPALKYTSKVFVKPGEATTESEFKAKLDSLTEASVSSAYFNEDSYAGINTALEKIDWSNYAGKYIVLITDAGGIPASDPLSSTHLDAAQLRLEAEHKGVGIYAMHLLTPSGERNNNHDLAKNQYNDLTFNKSVQKSLYYPINAGSVDTFGKKIDNVSNLIAKQVKNAMEGKATVAVTSDDSQITDEDKMLENDNLKLGHAMQMAFLGSKLGAKTPSFLKGWIADRDLIQHTIPSCEPVVLLTKNELSNLKEVTKNIIDASNEGVTDSSQMFNQLISVAVSLGTDPTTINKSDTLKLSELGLLGEFVDGLPYKSVIQGLDKESWDSLGPDEQNQIIQELEAKLASYQQFNDDVSRWVKLNDKEDISQSVFPVPLESLP